MKNTTDIYQTTMTIESVSRSFWCRTGTSDEQIVREMESENVYSAEGLTDVKTVLDIGAHIGTFSGKMQMLYPDAKVYAFEPVVENVEMCHRNIPTIPCFNAAVTGGEVPVKRTTTGANTGSNRFCYEAAGKAVCPFVSIKDIERWEESWDVVKIDCEGGEVPILRAMDISRVKVFMIEFHEHYETPERALEVKRIRKALAARPEFECICSDGSWFPKLQLRRI